MFMEIPVSEARKTLLDLVKRAEGGEEIVLTRHGEPVARLSAEPSAEKDPDAFEAYVAALQDAVRRRVVDSDWRAAEAELYDPATGLPV